jgi:hypothetical protein
VKRRLEQKLILRGSCDFEEPAEYGELLAEVFSALNAPRQRRYEQELEHLTALPAFRFADYEMLTVRVRSTSTIEVRQVIYSVPPSLIGVRSRCGCTMTGWSSTSGVTGFVSFPVPMAMAAMARGPGVLTLST